MVATIGSLALAAMLGLTTGAISGVGAPAPAQAAASALGGTIGRAEVMARAKNWYDRKDDSDMTYGSDRWTWDVTHSRQYRRDCSGYVDMAWHLNADPNTSGLDTSTYTTAISRSALRPGDILDWTAASPGHAVIFGGWEDSAMTRFWYYTFGSTPVRKVTGASFSDSSLAGHPTSQYQALRYRKVADAAGIASIYGVLTDGRLTFTNINTATATRTHTVVSTASLGFAPKAVATLNFNTILITSTSGVLHRVDVRTNSSSLTFDPPDRIGTGWTHDLLAYDGHNHLYGIADGVLRRYTITAPKPGPTSIVNNTVIDNGFTLKTLTTTGADWLLGTTSAGELLSYRIRGVGDWSRYELRSSTWQVFSHLLSPGDGVILGRTSGAMNQYVDIYPFDGKGVDLVGNGAVDTSGWTQILLSAQPDAL
jgi:hypothetical protein